MLRMLIDWLIFNLDYIIIFGISYIEIGWYIVFIDFKVFLKFVNI